MSNLQTPFRYDFVGSFLRPDKLKEARRMFDNGESDYTALKKVEDECIVELVAKIKELGYNVITDGEFRRATWHLDFMWGFDGVGHTPTETELPFHGEAAMVDDTYIVGRFGLSKEHPFVEHFRFVKALEDENTVAKQTMPSPAQVLAQFTMPFNRLNTEKVYSDDKELEDDIVAVYKKVIDDLYAAGCRNIQLDDCTWGMFADKIGHTLYGTTKEGLSEFQKAHKDINNRVIANAPKDMIINTHVCRGNFHTYQKVSLFKNTSSAVKTACRHSKPHAAAAEFRNQIAITPIKLYHSAHQISIVTYAIPKKRSPQTAISMAAKR